MMASLQCLGKMIAMPAPTSVLPCVPPLAASILLAFWSCLAACTGGPRPLPEEAPRRSCGVPFRYTPDGPVGSVQVAGSWNGFALDTHPMEGPDAAGQWSTAIDLPEGLHAYKFVVDGEWVLDPAHRFRAWDGGVENSGVWVDRCSDPRITFVTGRQDDGSGRSFAFHVEAGAEGPGVLRIEAFLDKGRQRLPLEPVRGEEAGTWMLSTGPLERGKYRLRVEATDDRGRVAEPLILPFWVEDEPWDWRDASIYMLMTDRFWNGEPTNDEPASPGAAAYGVWMGGDLQGVADKLREGWFEDLGVTALWLTPWNTNAGGAWAASDGVHQVTGFHGYWPTEPRAVDPRLGGEGALHDVVEEAHARGIRVLMDLVANHVHEDHPYVSEHPDWFDRIEDGGCVCGTPGCDWTERRLDCLFTPYLPDVRWTSREATAQFLLDAAWWVGTFDLDGLRVDAVKHVPDSAIFDLSIHLRRRFELAGTPLFLMGETAMGWSDCHPEDPACNADSYGTIARYLGDDALDGQFDFVLHHAAAHATFARRDRGLIHARTWSEASLSRFPEDAIMTPYVGSHDTPRFLTVASQPERAGSKWPEDVLPTRPTEEWAYRRAGLALTWNLTLPGAPLLYAGDEYGEWGGSDPDNRHPVRGPETWTTSEAALREWVAVVGRTRRDRPALRRGDLYTLANDEDLWAYARHDVETGDVAIVVLHAGEDAPGGADLYLPAELGVPDGQSFVDVIDGSLWSAGSGLLTVDVPAASARVLVPEG